MKDIINRIGEIRLTPLRFFGFWTIVLSALFYLLTSCSEDIDVQQSYPFSVEVMPHTDKIVKGQTVELRLEIKPEGNYTNTMYTIRYFQYDGEGRLKIVDGPVLVNNDRVLLEGRSFKLNYTALSSDAHKILVVIEDNFGSTPWEHTFEFNNSDSDKDNADDGEGSASGNLTVTGWNYPLVNPNHPAAGNGIS